MKASAGAFLVGSVLLDFGPSLSEVVFLVNHWTVQAGSVVTLQGIHE